MEPKRPGNSAAHQPEFRRLNRGLQELTTDADGHFELVAK